MVEAAPERHEVLEPRGVMDLRSVLELRGVTQRFFRRFGALAADRTPCGKPLPLAHAHALLVLLAQGELTQRALGAELGIDKSNVARLCAKMVNAQHVTQRSNGQDGRSRLVSLTSRGIHLAHELEASSRARFASLLAAIPEARRGDVILSLQLLVDALDTAPPLHPERDPE